MGPQAPSDFNPDQNPFESILSGMKGLGSEGSATDPAQMYGQMQSQSAPQGGQMPSGAGMMAPDPNDVTQPGANPGTSKHVLGALAALQKFISESDDIQEIQAIRGVIQILTRVMERDQEKQKSRESAQQLPPAEEGGMTPPEQMPE